MKISSGQQPYLSVREANQFTVGYDRGVNPLDRRVASAALSSFPQRAENRGVDNSLAGRVQTKDGIIIDAARKGDAEKFRIALKNGAQITKKLRSSALLIAAIKGHANIVEILLEDRPINDITAHKALQSATQNRHLEVIQTLLKRCNIPNPVLGNEVRLAFRNEDHELLEVLLGNGQLNVRGRSEIQYVASWASQKGHAKLVETLPQEIPNERYCRTALTNAAG